MAALSNALRVGLLAAALGAGTPGAARADALIGAEVLTFPNGFQAILHVDKRTPGVAVLVNYAIGARHEEVGKTGLAHLFEHLMFRGSEHLLPYSPWWYLQKAGALEINATTSFDRTQYYERMPSINLEPVLWLESDRLGFPFLGAPDLDDERQIVKNERRQRQEITPFGAARELVWKALFPPQHPYHGMVIGDQSHLDALTLAEAKAFFKEYYDPGNATLVLSGDFELEKVRELVRDYFAGLPGHPAVKPRAVPPVTIAQEKILRRVESIGTRPRLIMSWLTPSFCSSGDATADILTLLLQRGKSGALGEEQLKPGATANFSVAQRSLALQSVFTIEVSTKDPAALGPSAARIDRELADLAEHGVSPEALAAAKRWHRLGFLGRLQDVMSKAELLIESQECFGSATEAGRLLELTERVTAVDVQELIRKYLQPSQRVVVYATPPVTPREAGK